MRSGGFIARKVACTIRLDILLPFTVTHTGKIDLFLLSGAHFRPSRLRDRLAFVEFSQIVERGIIGRNDGNALDAHRGAGACPAIAQRIALIRQQCSLRSASKVVQDFLGGLAQPYRWEQELRGLQMCEACLQF